MITPKELFAQMAERKAEIEALTAYWSQWFPEQVPAPRQFEVWLNRYGFDICYQSTKAVIEWQNRRPEGKASGTEDLIKYASGCMKKKRIEADNGQA